MRIVPEQLAERYDGGIGGRCVVIGSQQVCEVVWAPDEREDDTGPAGAAVTMKNTDENEVRSRGDSGPRCSGL